MYVRFKEINKTSLDAMCIGSFSYSFQWVLSTERNSSNAPPNNGDTSMGV